MKRCRTAVAILGMVSCFVLHAGTVRAGDGRSPYQLQGTYESWSLRDAESIGMAGLALRREAGSGFSVGVGSWMAVAGERGGFITLGLDGAFHTRLFDALHVEAGVFLGAGGGHGGNDLVGGGLMLREYGGLSYEVGQWSRIGVGVSRVDFPNGGSIHATEPVLFTVLPLDAVFGADGFGAHEHSLAVVGRAVVTGPQADILLLGVQWRSVVDDGWYVQLETEGAAGGNSAGYMQILAGGGLQVPLGGGVHADAGVAIGGGGGGGVDTGGGLLLEASAGLSCPVSGDLVAGVSGSYLVSAGSFGGVSPSVSLGYRFGGTPAASASSGARLPLRVRVATEWYVDGRPGWRTSHEDEDVENLGLQLDYFVSPVLYGTGQAVAAYNGNAGAYMAGLLGGGVRQPLAGPLFLNAEGLAGVAGGGGMAVGSGLVWQVNAGIGCRVSPGVAVLVSGGRIGAFNSPFGAGVAGLSVVLGDGL